MHLRPFPHINLCIYTFKNNISNTGTKSAILALCLAAAAHGASVHTTPEASSFTRRLLSNKKGKGNSHKGPKGGNDGHHMNVTQICTEWVNNQSNSTDLGDASTNEALGPDTVLRAGGLDFINPPLCKVGQSQSPIDIRGGGTTNVPAPGAGQLMGPIVFNSWRGVPVNVTQTNHGPKLIYPTSGSDMLTTTVNGVTVSLLQWHAHSPSEHTFDGKNYDAEIHFVHQVRIRVIYICSYTYAACVALKYYASSTKSPNRGKSLFHF